MQVLPKLLLSLSLMALPSMVSADAHGAVHIVLPSGEEDVEDGCEGFGDDCGDAQPWYHHQDFYYYGYHDYYDPAEELEYDTAWPGQREDFSDILLR